MSALTPEIMADIRQRADDERLRHWVISAKRQLALKDLSPRLRAEIEAKLPEARRELRRRGLSLKGGRAIRMHNTLRGTGEVLPSGELRDRHL